jgi:two-component system LytT family response regulator
MNTQEQIGRQAISRQIRTLILAQHSSTRQQLAALLGLEPDLEMIAPSDAPLGTAELIAQSRPDLVLLEVTGEGSADLLELQAMDPESLPALIVIAPTSGHAMAAFDAHAVDYLLTPLQPGLVQRALQRARECLELRDRRRVSTPRLHLLEDLEAVPHYLTRLSVKQEDRVLFLKVEDIAWIEASDNYVILHVGRQRFILRERLSALEAALDPDQFFRINRSALINLSYLTELRAMFKGEHTVVLRDGSRLPLTREVQELEDLLKFA